MTDFNRPRPESNPDQRAESEPTLTTLQRHFDWVVSERQSNRAGLVPGGWAHSLESVGPSGWDPTCLSDYWWYRFNVTNSHLRRMQNRIESPEAVWRMAAYPLVYLGKTVVDMIDKVDFCLRLNGDRQDWPSDRALELVHQAVSRGGETTPPAHYPYRLGEGEEFKETNMGVMIQGMRDTFRLFSPSRPDRPLAYSSEVKGKLLDLAVGASFSGFCAWQTYEQRLDRLGLIPAGFSAGSGG